ncbi:vomeronasal type-2 receptor 26-like [Pyxicephalus adspersus]|uniref:vomeronasal type-2 receptor 26-like n=1 Tax=Pyxicephalus adspersus TaxID=30357 RepID=UPI003B5CAF0A
MTLPGDVLIGFLFPLHLDKVYYKHSFTEQPPKATCTTFFFESFKALQATVFAIEEINNNPNILANVTLGLQAYDSCNVLQQNVKATLQILTGLNTAVSNFRCLPHSPLAAVLGPSISTHAITIAHILGLGRFPQDKNPDFSLLKAGSNVKNPQISQWSTSPLLSDRRKFPSFFRTVPSDAFQSHGLAQLRSVCSESCSPGFRKVPKSGQPVCCHDCIPCPPGEISNETDSIDCFRCPWDHWPNSQKSRCLLKPIEYLSNDDPLGQTLTAISVLSFLIPVAIMKLFRQFRATPLVKANNYYISCLLLISLSLCFLCPLIFIGYPHRENCLLRHIAFGMVFTLCISCILAKTIIVIFAFIATMPDSTLRKWANPKVSYIVIAISSFIQLILCFVWLCTSPPYPEYNTQSKPGIIIVECNEGSDIAFWTMLGYLFLLASISFVVAFLARRLPDSFNEAQFITFSMLAFISVWISYIPASLSAQGKYTVAMEIFAILASSWALIICMFFPKCFIILFRPDMNTREFLMRNYI